MDAEKSTLRGGFLLLCVLAVSLHCSTATLSLELTEQDLSVKENAGTVGVTISLGGQTEKQVIVEIVPLHLTEYQDMGGVIPGPEISEDQLATPNEDFNATVQTLQIEPGTKGEITVKIDITDDIISEYEEMFVALLRVVSGADVRVGRNVTMIVIRIDSRDAANTVLSFNMESLRVGERAGMVNDSIFIDVQGMAEPVLTVNVGLSTTAASDFTLLSTTVTIPSGTSRVSIPFQVIDDNIYEGEEVITLSLIQPMESSNLYNLRGFTELKITIQDDDVAIVGIEVSGNQSALMEGESALVCVQFLGPAILASYIDILVEQRLESSTVSPKVSMLEKNTLFLFDTFLEDCFEVAVIEDEDITPAWTLTFEIRLHPFFYSSPESANVVFQPQAVQLAVLDNDGIPQAPSNVQGYLINKGADLLVKWDSTSTPLQPVQHYVVEVQSPTISRITKRQTSNHSNSIQRYITTETEVEVPNTSLDKVYIVKVCAENGLGRTCAKPLTVSESVPTINTPSAVGVEGNERGLPVWVYAVVGGVLLLLCLVMVCLLGVCVCFKVGRMKSYYPSKQENRKNQAYGSKGRYTVRGSVSASESFSDSENTSGIDLDLTV